jgi:hypothetical protein
MRRHAPHRHARTPSGLLAALDQTFSQPMQSPQFALQDDLWWTARAKLATWAGFQERGGRYGAKSSNQAGDGSVTVRFAPEGRGCDLLNASELALIAWFFEHESEVSQSLQHALVDAYPELREQYGYDADGETELPEVRNVEDLKSVVGLHSVNVHQIARDGLPYIGYEFGCNWEEEHGLGVLMHGTKIVEIGGADTAFLLWIAKQHAQAGTGEA